MAGSGCKSSESPLAGSGEEKESRARALGMCGWGREVWWLPCVSVCRASRADVAVCDLWVRVQGGSMRGSHEVWGLCVCVLWARWAVSVMGWVCHWAWGLRAGQGKE